MNPVLRVLASLKLTVALLLCAMAIVFFGTLDQVHWGIGLVQGEYFESLFCAYPISSDSWRDWGLLGRGLAGLGFRLPMPGGMLVGALLVANLAAAHFMRYRPGWKRLGITITHTGVLLLIVSGFLASITREESMLTMAVGGAGVFTESSEKYELALIDTTDAAKDRVAVVPEALIRDRAFGGVYPVPDSKLVLRVKTFWPNASVLGPAQAANFPSLPAVEADHGLAARAPMKLFAMDENFSPEAVNIPAALVEILDEGKSAGTWLVSAGFSGDFTRQAFELRGRTYEIALRPERAYLPFALRLEKFTHEIYPGTDIPKNFASDVTIIDPTEVAPRRVTISMNEPLRHAGFTFYQHQTATSRDGNTVYSTLQTVKNPSYALPYVAVAMVGFGMLFHFSVMLAGFLTSFFGKERA